jgi:3-methyladenine DNA glycosylase/8-oxoguanine DNA glycosylase
MGLKERPSIEELRAIAKRWAPYRTAAAVMLWQFYRKMPLME